MNSTCEHKLIYDVPPIRGCKPILKCSKCNKIFTEQEGALLEAQMKQEGAQDSASELESNLRFKTLLGVGKVISFIGWVGIVIGGIKGY